MSTILLLLLLLLSLNIDKTQQELEASKTEMAEVEKNHITENITHIFNRMLPTFTPLTLLVSSLKPILHSSLTYVV